MFFNWVLIKHHIFWEIEHFKGNVKKQNHLRKQLDTIVYPQTNHTIVYHDHSRFFLLGWNYSFGKPLVLIPRKMKLNKRKQTLAKEKVKGMFQKKLPQEATGHNSVPSNKPDYCGSRSFNWFEVTFNWFQFTFNWFQFTFNLLWVDFK